jgi:hypothetical protein
VLGDHRRDLGEKALELPAHRRDRRERDTTARTSGAPIACWPSDWKAASRLSAP